MSTHTSVKERRPTVLMRSLEDGYGRVDIGHPALHCRSAPKVGLVINRFCHGLVLCTRACRPARRPPSAGRRWRTRKTKARGCFRARGFCETIAGRAANDSTCPKEFRHGVVSSRNAARTSRPTACARDRLDARRGRQPGRPLYRTRIGVSFASPTRLVRCCAQPFVLPRRGCSALTEVARTWRRNYSERRWPTSLNYVTARRRWSMPRNLRRMSLILRSPQVRTSSMRALAKTRLHPHIGAKSDTAGNIQVDRCRRLRNSERGRPFVIFGGAFGVDGGARDAHQTQRRLNHGVRRMREECQF